MTRINYLRQLQDHGRVHTRLVTLSLVVVTSGSSTPSDQRPRQRKLKTYYIATNRFRNSKQNYTQDQLTTCVNVISVGFSSPRQPSALTPSRSEGQRCQLGRLVALSLDLHHILTEFILLLFIKHVEEGSRAIFLVPCPGIKQVSFLAILVPPGSVSWYCPLIMLSQSVVVDWTDRQAVCNLWSPVKFFIFLVVDNYYYYYQKYTST